MQMQAFPKAAITKKNHLYIRGNLEKRARQSEIIAQEGFYRKIARHRFDTSRSFYSSTQRGT